MANEILVGYPTGHTMTVDVCYNNAGTITPRNLAVSVPESDVDGIYTGDYASFAAGDIIKVNVDGTHIWTYEHLPDTNVTHINDSEDAADSLQIAAARLGNKVTRNVSTGTMSVYDFAGTSIIYTVTWADDGTTETRGKAT